MMALGKSPAAGDAYARAVELRPEVPNARVCLANALVQSGQLGDAEEVLREGLVRQPNSPELCLTLGLLLRATGDAEAGEALLRRAAELGLNVRGRRRREQVGRYSTTMHTAPTWPTPEMVAFYQRRTKEHIERVRRCLALLAAGSPGARNCSNGGDCTMRRSLAPRAHPVRLADGVSPVATSRRAVRIPGGRGGRGEAGHSSPRHLQSPPSGVSRRPERHVGRRPDRDGVRLDGDGPGVRAGRRQRPRLGGQNNRQAR